MGIEIDKLTMSSYVPKELSEINRLSTKTEETDETDETDVTSTQSKKSDDANFDTYKKSTAVSDSIEKQIKEQEAKIKEITENLAVLKENYGEAGDLLDEADLTKYLKSRDLKSKEHTENSLERTFEEWTKKYNADNTDSSIEKEYNLSDAEYENASLERIDADEAYDLAKSDSFNAALAYNSSSSQYISGLQGKRNAYLDLASMQRRLALAKLKENLN